jgi:hypothetical protein
MPMIIHSFFGGQLDEYCRQCSHLQRKIFDKTRKAQLIWSINYASDQNFSMQCVAAAIFLQAGAE